MSTPAREGETIEGSRTTRNRPYPVLKCSRCYNELKHSRSGRSPTRLRLTYVLQGA